jgi:hypothetical protein
MNREQMVEKYGKNVVEHADEMYRCLYNRGLFHGDASINIQNEYCLQAKETLETSEPIVLTFKTPDVLDAIEDEDDREKMQKWIEYGEYVRIEFDLSTMKATVLER